MYIDGTSKIWCSKCKLFGDSRLFEELDRTRKALDVANAVIMDYAKEKLEKKRRKISLWGSPQFVHCMLPPPKIKGRTMNDRFRFRATFSVSYYDENGNDKDIKLTVDDVAVYSGGEIGFSAQQMEIIINALKLPEIEQDTIWQFINDNYATSCYEWFVCDNAIVEQCTGLKDKNGNLIYEGDIVICDRDFQEGRVGLERVVVFSDTAFHLQRKDGTDRYYMDMFHNFEIIGNIHEQAEQKDVK